MTQVKRFLLVAFTAASVALSQAAVRAQEAPADEGLVRDPEAVAAYDQGKQLVAEGRFKEAVAAFNRASQIDVGWAEPFIGKGDALKELGDYVPAAAAYTSALTANQNSVEAYNGRGEAMLELQQIDAAMQDFSAALELDPGNAEVLSNVGHVLANFSRDPVQAIRRLDDALALNPDDARAYRDRGYAHVLLREVDKAQADMQKAIELAPDDFANYAVAASMLLLQDMHAPAIEMLNKAIETYKPEKSGDPTIYLDGYLSRADAWLKLGEKEPDAAKANAVFENVIRDADAVLAVYKDRFPYSGSAYYRKGRAQRMLQDYSAAIDSLTDAIQSAQGQDVAYMSEAYLYRGISWFNLEEPELARGDFEQASATGNGFQDPRVYLWIGYTYHKEGDYREAIAAYNEAIKKSATFTLAHVNRGMAYMDLREYPRAIESFNNAIRVEPNVGEHYYKTAYAYMRLGQPTKAVNFLNLALHKENPQPKMYRLMADALRELGRNELAEEYERKANAAPAQSAGP